MPKRFLESLRHSWFVANTSSKRHQRRRSRPGRKLSIEALESRQMLSITPLTNLSSTGNLCEKPQSNAFE